MPCCPTLVYLATKASRPNLCCSVLRSSVPFSAVQRFVADLGACAGAVRTIRRVFRGTRRSGFRSGFRWLRFGTHGRVGWFSRSCRSSSSRFSCRSCVRFEPHVLASCPPYEQGLRVLERPRARELPVRRPCEGSASSTVG